MRRFIPFVIFFIIFVFLASWPVQLNLTIENAALDLQFKIRGSRPLSDKIIVVYIGDEDIKALGGWPISRDYYSYAIHILSKHRARVIGLDIFFSKGDRQFPEFDSMLAEFMHSAGNVCLPFFFSEIEENPESSSGLPPGKNPNFPLDQFRRVAAGNGFSNLSWQDKIRHIPLIISFDDSLFASFGCELVRLYWGGSDPVKISGSMAMISDSTGKLRKYSLNSDYNFTLNHVGSMENVNTISFVSLITNFAENTEQIDFKDKIVVIMVAASGVAPVVQTPLNTAVPASLIHINAAENLIKNNFIRDLPLFYQWILIGIMLCAALYCLKQIKIFKLILRIIISFSLLILFSISLFGIYNLFIPIFYPMISFISMLTYGIIIQNRKVRREEHIIHTLLNEQVRLKETELDRTRQILSDLQKEIRQKSDLAEHTIILAEERNSEIRKLQNEINDLKAYMIRDRKKDTQVFEEIICSPDSKMKPILDMLSQIGSNDITVLITGETGTGKELIARAIHRNSNRKDKPFVALNCGALSETLLESELFGHEKGSFTGALNRRLGRFEMAHGGTIFLDEISETSPAFQVKLLRVLQESTFERVGGQKSIRVDIRIIAASNRDLQEAIKLNEFRADLFYRLNGFPIILPPLRARSEDIPLLAEHFLKRIKQGSVTHFSENSISMLQAYHWPGNVRELENIVQRAAILAQADGRQMIREDDLHIPANELSRSNNIHSVHKPLEKQILEILRSLKFEHASISKTAKALGNRDRGTITEYFRGLCFQAYVQSDYDKTKTIRKIANSNEDAVLKRVEDKLNEYLNNLSRLLENENVQETTQQAFHGLPKKYHTYLDHLLTHLQEKKRSD